MTLRQQAVKGAIWVLSGNAGTQILHFSFGIVLARALSPRDYGLVGMLAIFMAIGTSMVESGFGQALIQKKSPSRADYTSVFYINILIAILIAGLLCLCSSTIADFFNEPILANMIMALSFGLVIQSLTIVQNAILNKELKFKELSIINFFSYLISGTIAIPFAIKGYGVWSLVILTLSQSASYSILIWLFSNWRPNLLFSFRSIGSLYNFGSRLLLVGLLDNFFLHIYKLIIGKYFNASELGFYTRAQGYRDMISRNVFTAIGTVSFPSFSALQDDLGRLRNNFKRICELATFIVTPLLAFMAFAAEPLIRFIITEKWLETVPYLQILAIAGLFYPIVGIQQNVLKATGRAKAYLKMTVMHKIAIIISILITVQWGVLGLVFAQVFSMFVLFIIGVIYMRIYLNISIVSQVMDLLKYTSITIVVFFPVFLVANRIFANDLFLIFIQLIVGMLTYYTICAKIKLTGYKEFSLIYSEQVRPKLKSIFK